MNTAITILALVGPTVTVLVALLKGLSALWAMVSQLREMNKIAEANHLAVTDLLRRVSGLEGNETDKRISEKWKR